MIERFYKITKEEANSIGKFEYAVNQIFDPFCGEQVDGSYIISEILYLLLKDRAEIQRVDWIGKQLIEKSLLNTKIISI